MRDPGYLLTVASIISGFGVTIFTFRLQREIQMMERNLLSWIPWADRLVLAAVIVSILGVVIPLISISSPSKSICNFAAGACSASSLLLAGYVPSILAHYRFIFVDNSKPRDNPEPSEKWMVISVIISSVVLFFVTFLGII